MVGASDVKYRKSNNSGKGESMSSTDIVTNTENNYFDAVTRGDQAGGHIEYRVFYIINDHTTEKMEDVDVWLSSNNSQSAFSYVQWAIDPIAQNPVWPFTYSVYLDGVDENINCGNHADLWSQSLTKYSFTFWIFPIANGDGNDRWVVDHGGTSNSTFACRLDASSSVRIVHRCKSSAGAISSAISDSLNLNQWNFIACTLDTTLGSQNVKIFVNNVLGFQTANFTEAVNLSADLQLGETSTDYKGYIKDFRWYTSKALTPAQINDIYLGEDDAANPNYWLKMSESTGSMTDSIGAKTATLNGTNIEHRSSQEIAVSTDSPLGVTWLNVTNGPVGNEPNIGNLWANEGRAVPVWVKWIVEDTVQDAANDFCIFTVQGKIPSGGTAPPPTNGEDPVPAPVATDFTFAVSGDWGDESMTSTVVNLIKNNNPQPKVVLSVGDNAYDSGADKVDDWHDRIKPIDTSSIRFETAFGNHDNEESESTSNETRLKQIFGYTNTYNMFDYQNVRFISIDNTEGTSFGSGSTQYNKIKQWLSEGRNDPDIDWIVVYAHKPMFGGSSKHSYNDGNFNQAYFPLFDQYKVDLMCFGHNHHMAQSKQVKYNSDNETSPTVVDSATPYTGGAGRIHVISGAGGHDAEDLYEVSSFSQTEWKNDTDHGALFVTITNSTNTTTLTGRFKDTDGSTLRTFVINRTTT